MYLNDEGFGEGCVEALLMTFFSQAIYVSLLYDFIIPIIEFTIVQKLITKFSSSYMSKYDTNVTWKIYQIYGWVGGS